MNDPLSSDTQSPAATPLAAVIIPHYNDIDRLIRCLEALSPQVEDANGTVEAVVIDNASPIDMGHVTTRFANTRFLVEPTKGAAAARNTGVAATTAPYLIFMDADCVPASDWLATALQLMDKAPLTGGRVDTFDETPAPRSGAEAFEAVFAFDQKSYVEQKGFSVTANLLTSRAIFDQVGPFVVGRSEDLDWCRRAVAQGHAIVYADALRVTHPTRSDWDALRRKWHRLTAEGFEQYLTEGGNRLSWAARAIKVLASGLVHLPRQLKSPRLASGQERIRGAGTLLRLRMVRAIWMLRQALSGTP